MENVGDEPFQTRSDGCKGTRVDGLVEQTEDEAHDFEVSSWQRRHAGCNAVGEIILAGSEVTCDGTRLERH